METMEYVKMTYRYENSRIQYSIQGVSLEMC